jgi:UDP-glucose 4-epimerase
MSTILVTGGAGYIGSHTVVELLNAGHQVIIVDNLCNSSIAVLERIHKLAKPNFRFVQADVRDGAALDRLFAEQPIEGVIHFAGLKAVGESVSQPLRYFDNNVGSTLALLQAMDRAGVRRIVFSSSATVYGDPQQVPITEDSRLQVTNPYGRTKLMCEDILRDLQVSDPRWQVAILRYFNPVGAHISGLIGEHPNGIPNNLMPFITQVAVGQREFLSIFGRDYPTPDGTGVRDYIHVVDLAQGHLAALHYLQTQQRPVCRCPTALWTAARAMWRPATPTPHRRVKPWVGRLSWGWSACAKMPGAGNHKIPRAIKRAGLSGQPVSPSSELFSLGPQRRRRVFRCQQGLALHRPSDAHCGIVPAQAAFMGGVPVIGGFVQKLGRFTEHHKAVCKTWRDPQLLVFFCVQVHAHPLAQGGRALAQVHHHIKHLALHHTHQLALRVLDLVMQTAQHTLGRLAVVVLHKGHVHTGFVGKVALVEGLEEKAPGITKHLRLQNQHFRDGGGRDGVGHYLSKFKRYWP